MPKEMLTIELRRSPGQPWGMRIGGGVDRGKVLVLEKVRIHYILSIGRSLIPYYHNLLIQA